MKQFNALCVAWLIACLSVCCSLYFSEGFKLDTCNLCWIQRMCMYPLTIILGMAVYYSTYTIIPYIIPQLCLGCCAACYQIALQSNLIPDFLLICQTGPSCLDSINIGMGFISLPMLYVCACCAMMACLFYASRQSQDLMPVYIKIK